MKSGNKDAEAPATHPKCNLAAGRHSPWDLFPTLPDGESPPAQVQVPEGLVEEAREKPGLLLLQSYWGANIGQIC